MKKKIVIMTALMLSLFFIKLNSVSASEVEFIKNLNVSDMVDMGNSFIMQGSELEHGSEIWRSDGTSSGTAMIKDITPGVVGSNPSNFALMNGYVYFFVFGNLNSYDLWRSDGTEEGTNLVKVGFPGKGNILVNRDELLFIVRNPEWGNSILYKSDGTAEGTQAIKEDINNSLSSGNYYILANGSLYFFNQNGVELWKYDGVRASLLGVSNYTGVKQFIIEMDDSVYYLGANGLWKSDGTIEGTKLIYDGESQYGLIRAGLYVYFLDFVGTSDVSLCRSDGTTDGTICGLKHFYSMDINSFRGGEFGQDLFFTYQDKWGNKGGLMKSDGTNEGTLQVMQLDVLGEMREVGDLLYFSAIDDSGAELWRTNGTYSGTEQVADIRSGLDSSWPSSPFYWRDGIYFSAYGLTYDFDKVVNMYRVEAHFNLVYQIEGGCGNIIGSSLQIVNNGYDGESVEAVATSGCHFIAWTDGTTTSLRQELDVNKDLNLVAIFEFDKYLLNYSSDSNGRIIGSSSQSVYYDHDSSAVTAQPNAGYHFVVWNDGSAENPRTDEVVRQSFSVQAIFKKNVVQGGGGGSGGGGAPTTPVEIKKDKESEKAPTQVDEEVEVLGVEFTSKDFLEETIKETIKKEQKAESAVDSGFSKKLKGRILLQVEERGEAWYVNPKDLKKYYMANGEKAYGIMRYLGVGISNKDLEKIKTDKSFAKLHSGKIFLQIESHGEAYYIDTKGNAYYLSNGNLAYDLMRKLGLGVSNKDIRKIKVAELL